ncbi:beta-1,3-galactosyltransferase 5-like [Tigriopus californicus]|uniref:beta-1,3-galactosyltransferase 5-like n=1 Tax=Tigriopus californicus TaxID=6832 RepID=UPI0027D9D502|nr:beta-1,3-galactosyltransferase 5-like [Tigriopus californicus]
MVNSKRPVSVAALLLIFLSIAYILYSGKRYSVDEPTWTRDCNRNISGYVPLAGNASRHDSFYISQPVLPPSSNYSIVFMVVSDPDNFQERLDIRLTWGLLAGRLNMPVVFVIGRPDQHETSMNDLLKEQKDWKDLLLMDMVDTYKNLTLKSAAILSYIHHFDIDTRFVVKVDDDVYINLLIYATELLSLPRSQEDSLICHLIQINRVLRFPSNKVDSKWLVPHWMYSNEYYPPYCAGSIYAVSKSMVPELLKQIEVTPLITVEDVYITGVVRTKTPFGIKHMPNAVPNPASLCQNLNERKILIRSHFASFKQIHKRINKSNWWWSLAYNCGFKFE